MSAISAQRYRLLVAQLADEQGRLHGWKTSVARRLGVTQPWISYIESGEREAGRDAIELAITRLQLRSEFFYDPSLGDKPHYTKFVGTESRVESDQLPALSDFKAAYLAEHGHPLPERYVDAIVGLARSRGPDVITREVIERRIDLERAIERGVAVNHRPAEVQPQPGVTPRQRRR